MSHLQLFENVEQMDEKLEAAAGGTGMSLGVKRYTRSLYYFWARQWIASFGWFANDFAFYGGVLGCRMQAPCLLRSSTDLLQSHQE
jgi:hypothetical protein